MTPDTMGRRELLKLGGVTALGLGGALSARLVTQATSAGAFNAEQGSAYEAWRSVPTDGSPKALLAAAILGANPHNTQPWRFAIQDQTIVVNPDHRRSLPATDPTGIELITGLGCAIENIAVAAAAAGRVVAVETRGSGTAVVSIRSGTSALAADLFPALTERHTNRGPYRTDRILPASSLTTRAALLDSLPLVGLSWLQGAARDRFGDLVVGATGAIIADREQSAEINRWWRATRADIDRYRDGMTLDAQGLPPVTRFMAKLLPPTSQQQNDAAWLSNTSRVHVATAAAYGLLTVRDPDCSDARIQVGRAFQRLHLWATLEGLAMQPLNQITERIARDHSLGVTSQFEGPLAELTPRGRVAVFAFRIGLPTIDAGSSPRRPLAEVIVT